MKSNSNPPALKIFWEKKKLKLPKGMKVAAKKVAKELETHFNTKGQGWPLDFGFIKEDVFYETFGFLLEDVLLNELVGKGYKLVFKERMLLVKETKREVQKSKRRKRIRTIANRKSKTKKSPRSNGYFRMPGA